MVLLLPAQAPPLPVLLLPEQVHRHPVLAPPVRFPVKGCPFPVRLRRPLPEFCRMIRRLIPRDILPPLPWAMRCPERGCPKARSSEGGATWSFRNTSSNCPLNSETRLDNILRFSRNEDFWQKGKHRNPSVLLVQFSFHARLGHRSGNLACTAGSPGQAYARRSGGDQQGTGCSFQNPKAGR